MEAVRVRLRFENCFTVGRRGLGGGIALLWHSSINLRILSFSMHHIDSLIETEGGIQWRFTGVYGHPETAHKQHTWTLLKRLSGLFSLPWLCGGDFNEILKAQEKRGGQPKNAEAMLGFKQAVESCNFTDAGWNGYPYTWSNKRYHPSGGELIEERLDRFFYNVEWKELFPGSFVNHMHRVSSDHCPILMKLIRSTQQGNSKTYPKPLRFHYENTWSQYEECRDIIKQIWIASKSSTLQDPVLAFLDKIQQSQLQLRQWSNLKFKNRDIELKKLQDKLIQVRTISANTALDEIRSLESQTDNFLIEEEIYWQQRSRVTWLKYGDKNTKFFHAKATARKKKNTIHGILNHEGHWVEDSNHIAQLFINYYRELFSSSSLSEECIVIRHKRHVFNV